VQQGESLDRVESRGVALERVAVLPGLTVLAQRTHRFGERLVISHERARVADRSEVLGRIEAEGCRHSERARGAPVSLCAVRLASVLDDPDGVARGHAPQRGQVGHLAVEVHREQEARARRDPGRGRGRVEAVVVLADVRDDGHAAGLRDRLECRREGGRRHDDLVAAVDSAGEESEPERVEAARQTDAAARAHITRERFLELRHRWPVRERARVE
jgi:hypothetical protein